MQSDLVELGWTEDHWNRIVNTVSEEAQKGRVAAQALPIVGPEDASTVSIPNYTLGLEPNPSPFGQAANRLTVDSEPTLHITTIAVNVQLRAHEIADPDLKAALTIFRRAANFVARIEDALVFRGRPGANVPPPGLAGVVDPVFAVTGNGPVPGIFGGPPRISPAPPPPTSGTTLFNQIIAAINSLEAAGQLGPFACLLSNQLFEHIVDPTLALVLPRDRILPFLQGPLLRSSQIPAAEGCVIALSGSPIELVVACDINVRYLQNTLEPRYVFRMSERVALRIKEARAIALLG